MNHLYFYILLVLNFQTISGQACSSKTPCSVGEICRNKVCKDASCDTSSDVAQCSDGEICRNNVCEAALYCGGDSNPCLTTPVLFCVSDYCQPSPCTSTGQCVHGHVCSRDTPRTCVYPAVMDVEEGSEFTFAFKEPATPGSYGEIHWHRGDRSSLNRVVLFLPAITDNKTQYYNEFCSNNSPCYDSDRAHLNTDTGELTIHKVNISDEGFYYYKFDIPHGVPDTGVKYEYKLNVYVNGDLTIEDLPSDYVEVGTNLTLTCTIDRIRPEPLEMYWEINGRNVTGNITARVEHGEGVFSQTITYIHRVTEEDENSAIKCVVVPKYGDQAEGEKRINIGYPPAGKPTVTASPLELYVGEKVSLTCSLPPEKGNPVCDMSVWNASSGEMLVKDEDSDTYTFIVNKPNDNDTSAGNFTCRCGNKFGNSSQSNAVEVKILEGQRKSLSTGGGGGGNVALIGGAIGGILFIVLIIIIVVFITRRKNKPKAAPDDEPKQLVQNGVQPEPVYAQPDKSKRKLRPQRGLDEGPQYANTGQLQGENPYENTGVDNNNPPTKQNGIMPPELIYIEVDVGKKDAKANGNKPVPKERSSMRKTKINRSDDPTMYAEIQPKA